MEQMTTTAIFSLLETTKEQRSSFVNQVIENLQDGQVNPLKLHQQVKCMEQLLSDLKDREEYKELLLEEATKNGKKFEMHNAEFQIKEAGTKYDYSKCGDSEYADLLIEKVKLDAKVKAREKMLQSLPESGMANPENGEMLYPPIKTSTTIVQVSLK